MHSHATNIPNILSLSDQIAAWHLGVVHLAATLGNGAGGDAVSILKDKSNHICARVSACCCIQL